ncbi:type 4b pilus protein PilO2 [Ralstonia solanacearum]|uniref:type 4b pilus protein PilO2 n=1 Tax=Ralstonia solanacearum TaxID=305 RepID=UPI0005C56F43|nr:type 4b pilus protein PilO2 [Ralstonia solanacearum]MBB6592748.1 type 4b pilus protein PilO2 [Ralstonia solanacearum]MBB6596970.1 type 4b pilus protein PilO2 [Ralstonia solanacearum]MDB0541214.1 type 4b pilus protein PilO2 [Ralstonia solanacearum]MDB0551412.1 type 4b pilus protein PilO2 [Ralstonia solanacearum]MDB0556163.1 type 4b pilus protein PilO2 [Ralstonia solanacearum]
MAEVLSLPGIKGAYALGLSWRHEDRRPSRKALRKNARDLKARWSVVHQTRTGNIQAGFCSAVDGTVSSWRIKPLAALVADSHPQPWCGFYHLRDDLYWYIAVRDGQEVLPDGDRVGTLEELVALHKEHTGVWNEVRGNQDDLAKIVSAARSVNGLTDLEPGLQRFVVPAVCVGAVAALAFGGAWWYQQRRIEAQRAADLARQRATQAMLAAKQAKQQIPPWTQQPLPSAFVEACHTAWHGQALATNGWVLTGWNCQFGSLVSPSSVSVSAQWERDGGSAEDAPGMLLDDGNHSRSTESKSYAFTIERTGIDDFESAKRIAWGLAHQRALQLKLTAAQPGPLPGANGPDAPEPDPWIANAADFTLAMAPWLGAFGAFDQVPGLRLTEVSVDLRNGQWHAKGALYVNRFPGSTLALKVGS